MTLKVYTSCFDFRGPGGVPKSVEKIHSNSPRLPAPGCCTTSKSQCRGYPCGSDTNVRGTYGAMDEERLADVKLEAET